MEKYNLIVESNTLNSISKNIENYGNQLVDILEKCKTMMIDLEKYYNTPNGKIINDLIKEYLVNCEEYVKNHYYQMKGMVNTINNEYTNFYNEIQNLVK